MTTVTQLPNEVDRTISTTVKGLCSGRGISRDALAKILGISHGTMNSRLRCKTSWTAVEVRTIADYFGLRIGDLFTGLSGTFPGPGGAAGQPTGPEVVRARLLQLVTPEEAAVIQSAAA